LSKNKCINAKTRLGEAPSRSRIGIAGFGFMGRMHYKCYKALENAPCLRRGRLAPALASQEAAGAKKAAASIRIIRTLVRPAPRLCGDKLAPAKAGGGFDPVQARPEPGRRIYQGFTKN